MTCIYFFCLIIVYVTVIESLKCGQTPISPDINSNILGGTLAKPYSWPWQTGFYFREFPELDFEFFCGGSIIGDRWILTAGHCVILFDSRPISEPQNVQIRTGVFDNRLRNETGEGIYAAKAVYKHPLFVIKNSSAHDVALIELKEPITMNNHTQPICLPSYDKAIVVAPNFAWTTGWGDIGDKQTTNLLKQANIPFVNDSTCDATNSSLQICAGKPGVDPCEGDSGGPLVVKNKNNYWYQYGIVSFGKNLVNGSCNVNKRPEVFTRVTAHCDFIKDTTKGEVVCQDPENY